MKFGLVIMMNVIFLFSISAHSLAQKVDSEKEEKRYRLDKVIVRDHPLKDEALFAIATKCSWIFGTDLI